MNKVRKTLAGLDCLIVLSEEFIVVDDDYVCTVPILADEDILEFVRSSRNIIDADSDDENEMNNTALAPMSSEIRNVMTIMCSYLDAHFRGERNDKMDDIEQFVDNLMLKNQCKEK
ncbi:hypothetical protein TNCV_3495641 [Trichonephila clavipes]|nr:hypothetical protein TNCV_3495641 [Trichonephila clavipes]